jgi:hypothetical protein
MPTIPDFSNENNPDQFKRDWLKRRFTSAALATQARSDWSVRVKRMTTAEKGSALVATFLLTILATIASFTEETPVDVTELLNQNASQLLAIISATEGNILPAKTASYIAAIIGILLSVVALVAEIDQSRYSTAIIEFDRAFGNNFIGNNAHLIWPNQEGAPAQPAALAAAVADRRDLEDQPVEGAAPENR